MEQCRTDPCVIRMVVDGKVELIVAVQVDDIVIAGSVSYTHLTLPTKA